jgi:hypothetical protein
VFKFRIAKLRAEGFKIGEPLELGNTQGQPFCQTAGGFDERETPSASHRNRAHVLRFGNPLVDRNIRRIFPERSFEVRVGDEKADDFSVTRAYATGERVYIAAGQRPKPSPPSTERAHCARIDLFEFQVTRQQTSREHTDDRG